METELYSADNISKQQLSTDAVHLLKQLIAVPSFSGEEKKAVDVIRNFLEAKDIVYTTHLNNLLIKNYYFDPSKKSVVLNSHIDTVKPSPAYTRDPFFPHVEDEKLFGLGSNDAGGPLVSLLAAFLFFYRKEDLPYNLIFAATAEEEISGVNGIEHILSQLNNIEFAIIGEPTLMNLAIAERGLLVLDCIAHGVSGHAARNEGTNALYLALNDIEWFRSFSFPRVSELLGPVQMSVTVIHAGSQHNIVPAECKFTVDIRVNDLYSHQEILSIIRENVKSEIFPRSLRLRSSSIRKDHPFIVAGMKLGMEIYGSPTSSDLAAVPFPGVKLGPGNSARSHTANEFIFLDEIPNGVEKYIEYLQLIFNSQQPKIKL